jgi:dTDP-4-dehydrorhamnose reductase
VVVNAAAYTAVDRTESEPELAFRINADAAAEAAKAANAVGSRLIHISTDYVFPGTARHPILEDGEVQPVNAYGASKLAGERGVLAACPGALVVRTSWLVSPFGTNFVKTMLRLAAERDEVRVVADQLGSPTEARDLARALLALIRGWLAEGPEAPGGTYHLTGAGQTTWAGLAERVMAASAAVGGPAVPVRAITTAEFPTPARRPAYSVLDCGRAKARFGVALPGWEASIDALVARLVAEARPR